MELSLRLRMPDGAASITFHPRLTPEEYAELEMRLVDATTRDELLTEVNRLAAKWGKQAEFDRTTD